MSSPRPSAPRARALLSQFYRLAGHGNVPREAFLEAALAAALEDPEVWPRFADASGWARRLGPSHLTAAPVVSTQDWVAGGRTDIRLSWSDRTPVVLKLKVTDPPTSQQVETYLAGAHVAAVAKSSVPINVRSHEPYEWLGILTWQFFRDLNWPGAPPVLEQLHQLIDDMEVAVPRITLHGRVPGAGRGVGRGRDHRRGGRRRESRARGGRCRPEWTDGRRARGYRIGVATRSPT